MMGPVWTVTFSESRSTYLPFDSISPCWKYAANLCMYWSYGRMATVSVSKKLLYQMPIMAKVNGMFSFGGVLRKCKSIACAPACISIQLSNPIDNAIGVPIADHNEYRPPTQSQNPNMLFVSIPKSDTAGPFVDNAAKCFAIDDLSPANASKTHFLAVPALVMVSCVVNVLDAIKKSVVSGSHFLRISATCVPSTFEQKCIVKSRFEYGFKASQTITGPKSEPPIPILTTVLIDLPVWPFHSPDRTVSVNALMR
mmetsp:Transcript_56760/g.138099  ORF Transcript_56760/g.138099 Transcript_56760/m.138099 type:complete len:254 (+) Transcript_56760:3374-4135(+)